MASRTTQADAETSVLGIIQLSNLFTRTLAPVLRRYRITPQQWSVLVAIAQFDSPPTMAEISRLLLVSKQNITGMITRLEALELIRRADDPEDLRASRIQLSRKGERIFGTVGPTYRKWLAQTFNGLSTGERRGLQKAINKLLEALS